MRPSIPDGLRPDSIRGHFRGGLRQREEIIVDLQMRHNGAAKSRSKRGLFLVHPEFLPLAGKLGAVAVAAEIEARDRGRTGEVYGHAKMAGVLNQVALAGLYLNGLLA